MSATRKYIAYAVGEFILIVAGILVAMQINNWNTNRVQQNQFEKNIEQIYNSIRTDIEWLNVAIEYTKTQQEIAVSILHKPHSIQPMILAHILYYLDSYYKLESTESNYLLNNLSINTSNESQRNIAQQVDNYIGTKVWGTFNPVLEEPLIYPILKEYSLPVPETFTGLLLMNNHNIDTTFYSEEELIVVQKLIIKPNFKVTLRTLSSNKKSYSQLLNLKLEDAKSIINIIRNDYPDVKLRYDNIGILGDALATGYEKSVPMTLINKDLSIWEITIMLDAGTVKFRNRDSWNQNWGGKEYPMGKSLYYGNNIQVKPGLHKVTLNLTENTYEFEIINDIQK